ncbi:MAG: hypothetical protein WAN36_03360 [Calditrichia bacterium]
MKSTSEKDFMDRKPEKNSKPRVLIDLDGVVRDFVGSLQRVYQREYPDHQLLPVNSRRLEEFFPIKEKIYDFLENRFIEEVMEEADPYPGALEALNRWQSEFHLVIVTAQPAGIRHCTFRWIGRHCLPVDEVHISYYKSEIPGPALLDDFTDNLQEFRKTGRLAVCLDRPWNQQWNGERVQTVDAFFRLLQKKMYGNEKTEQTNQYLT